MAEGDLVWINLATWSQFLERLKLAGVEIAYTSKGHHPYLRRKFNGRVLTSHLPRNFDPENPDAAGRVGAWVFDSVRRKLKVEDSYFKGWVRALH